MYKKTFFFRQDRQLKKINPDEIIYLEAAKSYTKLYTANETYIARITLLEAMKLLPENKFLRVHRSFAVSADHIDVVKRDGVQLATIPVEVPVSRMYYVAFTKQFIILDSADIDTGKKRMISARERRS
ncbi:MAG: LytR/AlgR family response regulator transcription factor [Niastella sp.]|uniref:LytR/AlgR family response regulator transcription factor n=1 Tax=Niastella sp. TaxID=1869183 RepID=UPI00389AAD2F